MGGLPIGGNPQALSNTTPLIPDSQNVPAVYLDVTHSSVAVGNSATVTVSLSACPAFTSALIEIRVGDKLQVVSGQWLVDCILSDYKAEKQYGTMVFENASAAGEIFTFAVKGLEATADDEILVTVILHNAQNGAVATLNATASLGVTEAPIVAVGDLDGDADLTDWDGVLLARYLAGWSVEISSDLALDIDGDGEITDWDGVVFDRYLAGWNVQIG